MDQYAWVLDVMLLLIMAGITWSVSSEGLWGAALMFVNVMFAGLVSFCFFEPCANFIDRNMAFMKTFSDFVSLVLLFGIAFTIIRLATDNLGPTNVRFVPWLYQIGRYVFGMATAWYMVGMVLCWLETAPIHKKFLGFQWKTHAVWEAGVDRFWLGFVQTSTRHYMEWNPPKVFDYDSSFVLRYHDHRPFGGPDTSMPGHGGAAASSTSTEQAPAAGGAAPKRKPANVAGAAGIAQPENQP